MCSNHSLSILIGRHLSQALQDPPKVVRRQAILGFLKSDQRKDCRPKLVDIEGSCFLPQNLAPDGLHGKNQGKVEKRLLTIAEAGEIDGSLGFPWAEADAQVTHQLFQLAR